MKHGTDVRPKKWSNVLDLYDHNDYSAIWGNYEESAERVLGVRWNGESEDDLGYPNMAGYPVWYVEPKFLRQSILLDLLKLVNNLDDNRKDEYINNILLALRENT
ncbi:MAG: hypothetical protein WA080_10005 [Sulfuricurvum sp.]